MANSIQLNALVSVPAGQGTIKFIGSTEFATGKWIGIELTTRNGKNDGTIAGKRYFPCKAGYGVFVREAQINLLNNNDVGMPAKRVATSAATSRPPSRTGSIRTTTTSPSLARRPTPVNTSPTALRPSSSASLSVRPSSSASSADRRSPSPALSTVDVSNAPSPPPATLSRASSIQNQLLEPAAIRSRPVSPEVIEIEEEGSMSPPPPPRSLSPTKLPTSIPQSPARSRLPITEQSPRTVRKTIQPPSPASAAFLNRRESLVVSSMATAASTSGGGIFGLEDDEEEVEKEIGSRSNLFSLKGAESRKLAESTVPKKEHEELLAKLRILETRRAEDRERLREVDRLKEEAEEWIRVREKSRIRVTELSVEVKDLRKQTKELVQERDLLQSDYTDLTDTVEISLLDKEVAEERFEQAESTLESTKEKLAELEIEIGVLRQENSRMDGSKAITMGESSGGDSGTNSLAFVQMEKQNARLKEALVRLRDTTAEAEVEYRRRITDTEKELELTFDLQNLYDTTVTQLEVAESQVEDLKIQLDDALGAEDMLEQLSERNLTLSDKVEELQAEVEDLQAIKDLNDELEETHVETAQQMQSEIDLKDLMGREQKRRIDLLEDGLADYESTIGQFRELVISLQADLEQAKQNQLSTDVDPNSQTMKSQSQAMLNLNLKLHSSVLKGQVKTIELDLRKLDANQAIERLSIIRPYILPSFFEDDSDSVDALLFFERLVYKTQLISNIIELTNSVTESLDSTVPEDLIRICETRTKLARFISLAQRFAVQLKRCSPELFVKMGRIYYDIAGVEKRLDHFIDSLAKEEFRSAECARELDGFIAQAEHLVELHLVDPILDLAERQSAFVSILDLDLDTIAASIGFSKQTLVLIIQDSDYSEEEAVNGDINDMLFTPLQNLINMARNSKVIAKKLLIRLGDLITSSSALNSENLTGIETLAFNSSAIAVAASRIASEINAYSSDLHASKDSFDLTYVMKLVREIVASELGRNSSKPLEEMSALLTQLSQDVTTTLGAAQSAEQVVKLAYIPPWIERVTKLQRDAAINVDAERQVVVLNEEIKDLVRERRSRETIHSEDSVKIELMEKRLETFKKQADAMLELEGELVKSKKSERGYEEAIETLQKDLGDVEEELAQLKASGAVIAEVDPKSVNPTINFNPTAYDGNMETSRLVEQIESLRGAVRYLRSEIALLKSQDLMGELDALPRYTYNSSSPFTSTATDGPKDAVDDDGRAGKDDAQVQDRFYAASLKSLLHEARILSATPKVVDLSFALQASVGGEKGRGRKWMPASRAPEMQWMVEKERTRELSRKLEKLTSVSHSWKGRSLIQAGV